MSFLSKLGSGWKKFLEDIAPIPPEGWAIQLDNSLMCSELEEAKKYLQFTRFPKWEQEEIYTTALWAFAFECPDHPLADSLIEWMEGLNPELNNYDKYIIKD